MLLVGFPPRQENSKEQRELIVLFLNPGPHFVPQLTRSVSVPMQTRCVSVFTGIPVAVITLIGDINKIHSLSRSPLCSVT